MQSRAASTVTPATEPVAAVWKFAVIGVCAGAFSGLFGVGGGTVIVPLLVLWLGFGEKVATGTSLLAIALIAALAAAGHGAFGEIDVVKGLLVGVPAIGGVVVGTTIQQRMSDRLLAGLFAVLLLVVAVLYVVT
jgi:uncharacterized membrane protein YfcA